MDTQARGTKSRTTENIATDQGSNYNVLDHAQGSTSMDNKNNNQLNTQE